MTYSDAVRQLVEWHFDNEQPPIAVLVFTDPSEHEIRLLQVTELVPETGEVYPIIFGPTKEIPYRTVLAQVTPSEYEAIRARELELPEGWDLEEAEEMRPAEATA